MSPARIHGLTAAQLCIPPSDVAAFESLRTVLAAELAPHGELEYIWFDTILHAQWNLRLWRLREAQLLNEQNEAKLALLDRHIRRHQTNLNRALQELKSLQTERAFREQNEPKAEPAPAPALADTKVLLRLALQQARALDSLLPVAPPPSLAASLLEALSATVSRTATEGKARHPDLR